MIAALSPQALRAAELRAAGRCAMGPLDGDVSKRGRIHGPIVAGGRCANCCALHKEARATAPTMRQIVEAHQHLSLDAREDREALIDALEQRRKRPQRQERQ